MINWGLLYEQGRVKAIGVPWTEAEATSVFQLKIPAEYVRQGFLTLEAYEAALKGDKADEEATGQKKLRYMNKPELLEIAKGLGLSVTDEVIKSELISMIEQTNSSK